MSALFLNELELQTVYIRITVIMQNIHLVIFLHTLVRKSELRHEPNMLQRAYTVYQFTF